MALRRIKSIIEYHQYRGLPQPEHPLISLVRFEDLQYFEEEYPVSLTMDLYSIALKRNINGKIKYGQQKYDYDAGVLFFMAPGQVFSVAVEPGKKHETTGWMLLLHPDFIWGSGLAKKIKQYDYFEYETNEALFLSDKEESSILHMLQNIKQEYQSNIDRFSQELIVAQLELLLKYADRYYNRQFLTRTKSNHQTLVRLEKVLDAYFEDKDFTKGLPSVATIAQQLHISPNYLSALLKVTTGQTTQQHIHNKVIEKAKEKLSTTNLTVSEIAFELGFEHSPSFTKFFKTKTNQSPIAFRKSFN